jgi:hypothetical protein
VKAKTTKGPDAAEDVEETADVVEDSSPEEAAPPAGKKKVRRVRVIEVIDDDEDEEDLDDVLEAIDEAEPAPAPAKRPKKKPAAAKKTVRAEKPEEPEDADAERAESRLRALLASPRATVVLVVVLIAALASTAIWQWRQAAGLSAQQGERREIAEVAGAYGDAAFSYTAQTYQAGVQRNLKLLGGDLLSTYKQNTVPNLPTVFSKNPQLVMTSKIKKVYVGDVNGNLATAVILVDIKLQTPQGVNDGSNALLRLSLAKGEGGTWRITQQAASGQSDDAAATGQVPGLPSASTAPSPKGSKTPN